MLGAPKYRSVSPNFNIWCPGFSINTHTIGVGNKKDKVTSAYPRGPQYPRGARSAENQKNTLFLFYCCYKSIAQNSSQDWCSDPHLSTRMPFVQFNPADSMIRGIKAKTDYRNIILQMYNFSPVFKVNIVHEVFCAAGKRCFTRRSRQSALAMPSAPKCADFFLIFFLQKGKTVWIVTLVRLLVCAVHRRPSVFENSHVWVFMCLTPGSAVCNKTLKIKIIFFVGSVNFIDFTAKGNTPVRVSILLSGEAIQVAKWTSISADVSRKYWS